MYNKLLERQIKRNLKGITEIPEQFKAFMDTISQSYDHYEADRKMIDRSLELSSQELNEAYQTLHQTKQEIEEKNKDIMDSIHYAKRIQVAILPSDHYIKQNIPNSFVLFIPKDIVSGDFYWMDTKDGKILFSAVDCTGHGVPGAFMSIVGHNGLNRAVNEYQLTKPAEILDKLNDLLGETLRHEEHHEVKDGMDMALCCLDIQNMKLEYAGANNEIYLIRKSTPPDLPEREEIVKENDEIVATRIPLPFGEGSGVGWELIEVKADKQPIGAFDNRKSFTNHSFDLQKGDTIYIFTDGFADQFGGPKGKKFKYAQLKELLLSNQEKTMEEQKELLHNTIQNWRGELEQIDDICVIGVRV